MAEIKETYVDYKGFKTYCKIFEPENPAPGKKPLLVLHGGPGDCHNYLLTYGELADRAGRKVVFYDQIGCGKSMIPHQDDDFYNYDLWVDEFYTVRKALGLDDIHLFGNSWGGMLGMLCMMKDDSGVNSFVINSSPVRIQTWLKKCKMPLPKPNGQAITIPPKRKRHRTNTTNAMSSVSTKTNGLTSWPILLPA